MQKNRPSKEPESKQRLRLWLRLLESTRLIENQLRDGLRSEFNSTLPRFDVMAALSRYEKGLKLTELSEVLRVSNGNITGLVDRLVADGLIVRVAVPGDRRATLVRLTRKGKNQFTVQAAAHEQWVDELLAEFSADESALLSGRLEQLRNSIQTTDE